MDQFFSGAIFEAQKFVFVVGSKKGSQRSKGNWKGNVKDSHTPKMKVPSLAIS